MKNYYIVPQEKDNYCVCSVLQAIFKRYSIEISQDEIAKKLTPSKKGFEVHSQKIKDFIKSFGLEYEFYWHNETPFNEPESVLKDIIQNEGFIGIKDHAYLLEEFNDPCLELIDPKDLSRTNHTIYSMYKKMNGSDKGFFGLIKKVV